MGDMLKYLCSVFSSLGVFNVPFAFIADEFTHHQATHHLAFERIRKQIKNEHESVFLNIGVTIASDVPFAAAYWHRNQRVSARAYRFDYFLVCRHVTLLG